MVGIGKREGFYCTLNHFILFSRNGSERWVDA